MLWDDPERWPLEEIGLQDRDELRDKVHEVVEVLHGLLISPMKRHHAFAAFVELRQVAGRLLENHEGNKLEFYDHLNRIVKVRAFEPRSYGRARVSVMVGA